MILPCENRKFRAEREEGHRVFIKCSDEEKYKGFKYDDFFYHHSCSNYEPEKNK